MSVTGRNSRAAFAVYAANSWGVAASVTSALHLKSDAGMALQPQFSENETFNQGFYRNAAIGDITPPDLTLEMDARYEDFAYVLEACCLGSPATPVVVSSTGGNTYRHVIDMAPAVQGRGITLAVQYGGANVTTQLVQELTSAKVYGMSEAVGTAGVITQAFKLLGSKPVIDSTRNVFSTVANATVPDFGNKLFRKQGVFRMNAQSAAVSLTSTHAVEIESLSWEFSRVNDAPFVFGQDFVIDPADNGFPTLSLSVTFPRMTTVSANSMYTALAAGGAWKGDLTYTGAVISGGTPYSKLIQFPYLEPQEMTLGLAGAQQVKPTVKFMLKEVAAAPTGMSGVTRPIRITRVMVNSLIAF
jgi:hypothetical protein